MGLVKPAPAASLGAWLTILHVLQGAVNIEEAGFSNSARKHYLPVKIDSRAHAVRSLASPAEWRGGAGVAKECYLVDPASSHMLVSKIKPCMCKYELIQTVKLRMAH